MGEHHPVPTDRPAADADLLWQARSEGDESAARALVERHTPGLLGQVRRNRLSDEDVEEVLQTTFSQFFEQADDLLTRLGPTDSAGPLLMRIAKCRVIDLIRKRERYRNHFGKQLTTRDAGPDEADERPALGELAMSRDGDPTAGAELGELWDMVDVLPEREREAVLGRCRDDLTFAEIGRRFDVSAAHAFRLYQAGLEELRKRIGTTDE